MAMFDTIALAVQSPVDPIAFAIEALVDAVSLTLKMLRTFFMTVGTCTFSAVIHTIFDPVALVVQSLVDAISTVVEAVFNAFAAVLDAVGTGVIGPGGDGGQQDEQSAGNQPSGFHDAYPFGRVDDH